MNDYITTELEEPQETMVELPAFCVDAVRKISWPYICWLSCMMLFAWVVYLLKSSSQSDSILPSVFVYFFILTIHIIFRFIKGGMANILSPEILFLVLYTMFHLGYVTLYALGAVPFNTDVIIFESSIPKALFIINIGLISFLFGFEIPGIKAGNLILINAKKIPGITWNIFGIICMAIALTMHFSVISYLSTGFFQKYGYAAIQDIEKYTGSALLASIFQHALHLMILGSVVYMVSSALRYGKLFKSKIALGLIITFASMIVLEGDRGPLVELGVPILLIRHYLVKQIKIRYVVLLFLAALMLFAAMAVVRTTAFDPTGMAKEYKYQRSEGNVTWMNPFVEMGSSFLVLDITAHEVPSSEPYWKGASWRDGIYHIIPFLQGFMFHHGWATWAPSDWITTTYFGPDAAGRAFTVAAEGYLNFGYLGVIMELGICGMFIRWLTIKFSQKQSAAWGIIMFGSIALVMMIIRNHMSMVINLIGQLMIFAALLNTFLGNETVSDDEWTS